MAMMVFKNDDEKDDVEKCDKYDLYDQKFNPHGLAHRNIKAKEGLGFLLPGNIQ